MLVHLLILYSSCERFDVGSTGGFLQAQGSVQLLTVFALFFNVHVDIVLVFKGLGLEVVRTFAQVDFAVVVDHLLGVLMDLVDLLLLLGQDLVVFGLA